jgi:hypothetical protein
VNAIKLSMQIGAFDFVATGIFYCWRGGQPTFGFAFLTVEKRKSQWAIR